jgi:non-heme chloroperoxidase
VILKSLFAGLAACLAAAVCAPAQAETRLSMVVTPDKVHLLVAEAGDPSKPAILFIHGFAQSYLSFRRQFDSDLATKYHLVAFDLRGEGGSDKPTRVEDYKNTRTWADDVAAVIKAKGLKRPLIVGWSYGGFVAMDYVKYYGVKNVAGFNMVGSLGGLPGSPAAPPPGSPPPSDAMKAIRANSERARSLDLLDNVIAGNKTAAGYVTDNMTQQDKDTLIATEMMMPSYVRRFMAARDLNHMGEVAKLTAPVLFTRGSRDATMPQESLAKLLRQLPNAKLSAYDDTGHLTFVEHPERFNRELDAFATASGAQ